MADTHYIVTGAPRSGTSMMMRCLEKGGMDCYYVKDDCSQNKYGNYEPSLKEYRRSPIGPDGIAALFKHPGKVIKLQFEHLLHAPDDRAYKVIMMVRDPEAITKSARAVWEKSNATEIYADQQGAAQYCFDIGTIVYKLTMLKRCYLTIVPYNHFLDEPHKWLRLMYWAGWPIYQYAAAEGIDKTQKHF